MFGYEFDQIIREHFDLSDRYTRKYIASITEDAQRDQLLTALSSALYNKIVTKVDDIDFGSIPKSRGDITKVQGFESTEECLNIIRNLVIEYKQDPAIVDIVISAVNNVRERKALFMKGFALNAELPMLIYDTIVLAIERSTSLMIATCIEYIKDPTSTNMKMALDKAAYTKTMDDMLFKELINFNNMCHNGQMDKTLDSVMKNPVKFRSAKEEVENLYNTVHPIDEEDPTSPEMPDTNNDSPFDTDSTVEPFENKFADAQPMTDDEDIPAPNEFPEYSEDPAEDEAPEDEDDIDLDLVLHYADNEVEDEVEPENIPTVNPSDDVYSSDTPITEFDEDEDDETNSGVPYYPESEEPVEEIAPLVAIGGGLVIGTITAAVVLPKTLKLIISSLQVLIYNFYYTKIKLSEYLEIQADLIEANANDLQYSSDSTLSDKDRKKVVKKQLKIAAKLRKWANKLSIDNKTTSNKAKQQINNDNKNDKTVRPNDDGDDTIF